jgi:hypothetical protein
MATDVTVPPPAVWDIVIELPEGVTVIPVPPISVSIPVKPLSEVTPDEEAPGNST